MRSLARILQAAERMIDGRDVDEEATEMADPAEANLNLLDVKKGSARYPVAAARRDYAIASLKATGAGIQAPRSHEWSEGSLGAIEELSQIARSLGCEIQFRGIGPARNWPRWDVLALIEPSTYSEISVGAFVRGDSSAVGKVERVGGATQMRCSVRLQGQPDRLVYCSVDSPELVRALGACVYQDATLTGRFTWLHPSWRVRHIEIRSVHPLDPDKRAASLLRLREIASKAWGSIKDPTAFVAELRTK